MFPHFYTLLIFHALLYMHDIVQLRGTISSAVNLFNWTLKPSSSCYMLLKVRKLQTDIYNNI